MAETTGDAVRDELKDAMAAERAKKSALEAKGLSVISTSGALLTLLLGFAALVGTRAGGKLSSSVATAVTIGVVCLAFACLLGIAGNLPGSYLELKPSSMLSMTPAPVWVDDGADARRELSIAHIAMLTQWRRLNQVRGMIVLFALLLEVLGIVIVGIAVVAVAGGR